MAKDASQRAKKNTAVDKTANAKNGKQNNKNPNKFVTFFKNLFKKIGDGFRKLKSELKKVTWPNFKDVLKQTSVVLFVTFIFLVVVGCIDLGLTEILKLLVA